MSEQPPADAGCFCSLDSARAHWVLLNGPMWAAEFVLAGRCPVRERREELRGDAADYRLSDDQRAEAAVAADALRCGSAVSS